MNEIEKATLGAETLQDFCKQFGEDVYAHVLLEELFEGLINAEALFVFGEQEQTGNQANNGSSGTRNSELGDSRPVTIQSASSLGEADRPDYP